MREINITLECNNFIEAQDKRVRLKFYQLIEIISELKVVSAIFVKKLQNTHFYELRIKSGKAYRIIIFTVDHLNFNECTKVICLYGFQKKSTKDYKKAIKQSESILNEYLSKEQQT